MLPDGKARCASVSAGLPGVHALLPVRHPLLPTRHCLYTKDMDPSTTPPSPGARTGLAGRGSPTWALRKGRCAQSTGVERGWWTARRAAQEALRTRGLSGP